uniref:Serpin domain-containing protein n=1 Tax=Salvator merianae TaxID=96440 RepID=A0A8D0BPJ0_SALMN
MTTLSEAHAKFAVKVFQSLTREHSCDNVVFSPVNLTSGFGLLALGSGCEQAAEIEKVGAIKQQRFSLQYVFASKWSTPEGVHTAFSKILATLNEPNVNYTLRFANKLYGDHAIVFIQVSLSLYPIPH